MAFSTMVSLDRSITTNLEHGAIKTRPAKSNGIWCHMLLPCILCTYCLMDSVSGLYKVVTVLSCGLFSYCSLFVTFLSMSSLIVKEPDYGGCMTSSLISTLMLYDFSFSFLTSTLTMFSFLWLLRYCLMKCPMTFTIGEAMIVLQGVILFAVSSVIRFLVKNQDENEDLSYIYFIVQVVLVAVALMVTVLFSLSKGLRSVKTLISIVLTGGTFILILFHYKLGPDFIPQFLKYVFINNNRGKLMVFWIILTGLSVCALLLRTQLAVKADTVTRKTFHVLASLVFLSGILLDLPLMLLAAGIGLGLIVFVEALRISDIEPVTTVLQAAFLVYSDEKDCGRFAMTPLYLYIGLASPLLLVPFYQPKYTLELLSGVLSIGVGDTAASWFGSKYGVNKWSDSSKTMEGTAFNILSQVATVYALILFDLLDTRYAIFRTAIAATVTSLVEAKTDQVDNLVLPFTMLIALQFTRLIC
ncbi:unnamed protein product [Leptidea sinapis]|uniref:dolichol kinase n=1 Tax=Leptidea sinapis TaxID=189913 RepID=A0A5E4QH10_9NEOP|nr:unnamed protein product [Leptidea sinapis]